MPVLTVTNGHTAILYGLGTNVPLSQLSEKRITKKVREHLRGIYGHGHGNVKVSCSASFMNGVWHGACDVNGNGYRYEIR